MKTTIHKTFRTGWCAAVLLLLAVVLLPACRRNAPRQIPDKVFKDIFIQAALADSYLTNQNSRYRRDTLRYFEPILKAHGYTMKDLDYTLGKLALRKSNVIVTLMTEATEDIDRLLKQYEYANGISLRWDKKAIESARDTVLFIDSLRLRSLGDLPRMSRTLDSLLSGTYTITYKYRIDSLDRNKNHVFYSYLYDTLAPYDPAFADRSSVWMGKGPSMRSARQIRRVNSSRRNRLQFDFVTLGRNTPYSRPYVALDSIAVVYDPPVEYARRRLFNDMLYGPAERSNFNKYLKINEKDSIALLNNVRPPVK